MKNKNQVRKYKSDGPTALSLRNPSKHRLPYFQFSSGYHFITLRTYEEKPLSLRQKDCIFNIIHFMDGKIYELLAAVVLDDHVHLIIKPEEPLSKILYNLQSYSTYQICKMSDWDGKIWQDEYTDWVIRNENQLLENISYIANNPMKEFLALGYEDYHWLYVKGWINAIDRQVSTHPEKREKPLPSE